MKAHRFINSDKSEFDSNCLTCGGKDRDSIHNTRNYSIYCDDYKVTSDALIAEYERRELPIPSSLNDLVTYGSGYSNQDFDVLSSAIHALAGGNDILPIYQALNSSRTKREA